MLPVLVHSSLVPHLTIEWRSIFIRASGILQCIKFGNKREWSLSMGRGAGEWLGRGVWSPVNEGQQMFRIAEFGGQ